MPRDKLLQLRRGTAAAWTSANPVLAAGEPGLETDTNKIKYGDGTSTWSALAYSGGQAVDFGGLANDSWSLDYNPATAYTKGDIVSYLGKFYRANADAAGGTHDSNLPVTCNSTVYADAATGSSKVLSITIPAADIDPGDVLLVVYVGSSDVNNQFEYTLLGTTNANETFEVYTRPITETEAVSGFTFTTSGTNSTHAAWIRVFKNAKFVDFSAGSQILNSASFAPSGGSAKTVSATPHMEAWTIFSYDTTTRTVTIDATTLANAQNIYNPATNNNGRIDSWTYNSSSTSWSTFPTLTSSGGATTDWTHLKQTITPLIDIVPDPAIWEEVSLLSLLNEATPLLSRVVRTNISITTYTTTSTVPVDVDATNLAVTFTAPGSGAVTIKLAGCVGAGSGYYHWSLRSGTTNITTTERMVGYSDTTSYKYNEVNMRITGLVPGQSYTYKWAHRVTAGTGALVYGGTEFSGANGGPLIMEVYEA